MLPHELILQLTKDMPLEDIVSLNLTCRRFFYGIPERVFRKALSPRCPSFTPYNTPRNSWAECARVHVHRCRYFKGEEFLPIFNIGKKVEITPTHNTPLPPDFVSLMDYFESRYSAQWNGVYPGLMGCPYYMTGNKFCITRPEFKLGGTVDQFCNTNLEFKLGEDRKMNKILTSPTGIQLYCSNNRFGWYGYITGVQTVITDSVVVYTRLSGDYKSLVVTIKFVQEGIGTDPDIYDEIGINDGNLGIDVFTSGGEVFIVIFEADNMSLNLTSYNKEGKKESRDHIIQSRFSRVEKSFHILFDGGYICLYEGGGLAAHFYDTELGNMYEKELKTGLIDMDGYFVPYENQRFVVIFDEEARVSRVWDLYDGVHHFIPKTRRADVTMVGLLEGKIMVATYDQKFLHELLH